MVNCLLVVATKRTFFGRCFVHVVEVFVESAVSSNELGSSSVVFPVGYERSVEVADDFCVITSQDHFSVFGTVFGHNISVKFDDFVVNKFVDV